MKMLRVVAGVLVGFAVGAVFSFLFLSGNWAQHAAKVPLGLQAAIGLVIAAIAIYRMRQHGLGFTESMLLGIALSLFAVLILIVWVVTGV